MIECIFSQSAANLWLDNEFQEHYQKLKVANIKDNLVADQKLEDAIDFSKLIRAASIFSLVKYKENESQKYHEAAFRISYITRKLHFDTDENISNLSTLILARLGNFPTIKKQLANDELEGYLDNVITHLPHSLALETLARYDGNKVTIAAEKTRASVLELTDFQRGLWEGLNNEYKLLSFSSPTSSGKTFILQNFLVDRAIKNPEKFVSIYIVPTRALISEVSHSLRELLKQRDETSVRVLSLSVGDDETIPSKVIYVFTQERLLSFLSNKTMSQLPYIDLVMIDEAHQISERARGALLHQSINRLNNSYNVGKFVFCSPVISNPQLFEKLFVNSSQYRSESQMTTLSPVTQNLIVVSPLKGITDNLKLELYDSSINRLKIFDSFQLPNRRVATSKSHFLAYCSFHLGKGKRNIIYVDGPSSADTVASELIKMIKTECDLEEISELSTYLQNSIHSDYVLAKALKYRIGIHYGKMPSLVRDTIERLFREEKLDFIICTSTLAQGVNLPAQNLFILDPKVQDSDTKKYEQIDRSVFWNIVGRAGRLYKDFEGNVFLLKQPSQIENWEDTYLCNEKLSTVIPATESVIAGETERLIEHLTDPEKNANRGIEEVASYIYDLASSKGGIERELALLPKIDSEMENKLISAVNEISEQVSIPDEIIKLNVGVSPVRQQALFDFLLSKENIDEWLLPRNLSNTAKFHFIVTHILEVLDSPAMDKDSLESYGWVFTIPAISWMQGVSLNRMISKHIDYKRRTKYQGKELNSKQINSVIRGFFGDIETNVRFKLVKYINCYNNLLTEVCRVKNEVKLMELIPVHLPLFLEAGVSNPIQLDLVSLGLSRITAIEISDLFRNAEYTESYDLLPLLERVVAEKERLPLACLEEIKRVLN